MAWSATVVCPAWSGWKVSDVIGPKAGQASSPRATQPWRLPDSATPRQHPPNSATVLRRSRSWTARIRTDSNTGIIYPSPISNQSHLLHLSLPPISPSIVPPAVYPAPDPSKQEAIRGPTELPTFSPIFGAVNIRTSKKEKADSLFYPLDGPYFLTPGGIPPANSCFTSLISRPKQCHPHRS